MQVHVDRGGERYGPYSLEDVNAYLANGTLLPTDQAWQDGMADWVPIEQIPGVTTTGGSAPPPPPPAPAAGASCPQCQAPVEENQVICMGCGTRLRGKSATTKGSKKKFLIGIGTGDRGVRDIISFVIAIIACIWFFFIREDESQKLQKLKSKKEQYDKNLKKGLADLWAERDAKTKAATKAEEQRMAELVRLYERSVLVFDPRVNDGRFEKTMRSYINKPKGELTKADLWMVRELNFYDATYSNTPIEVSGVVNNYNNRLTESKLTELPKWLERLTQLERLNLSGNNLTDVKGLENLPRLTFLELSYNDLTSVKSLEKLTQLKELNLSYNKLTGVKGLENLTQLKYLSLWNNPLTDVKGLEKLTQLGKLVLSGNPTFLTRAQIVQLQKALPNCYIEHDATK